MKYRGGAALCLDESQRVLMVLQTYPDKPLTWSLPTGICEENESFTDACRRETFEETGYIVRVDEEVYWKERVIPQGEICIVYFSVTIVGGGKRVQDPDGFVVDVQWVPVSALGEMKLSYPEDKDIITGIINNSIVGKRGGRNGKSC